MSSALRRFVDRAPRYTLKPTDNQVMRYATDFGPKGVFRTKLVNLSETGAAFVVDRSMAPQIGEMMKIELPLPNLDQIAWFGQVVRMEGYSPKAWWSDPDPFIDDEKMLVAVRFHDLPSGHRLAIKQGLQNQFLKELRERRKRQQLYLKQWVFENALKVFGYALLSVLSFTLLYFLSMPSANYDSKRGAPWGQRFQIFNFSEK